MFLLVHLFYFLSVTYLCRSIFIRLGALIHTIIDEGGDPAEAAKELKVRCQNKTWGDVERRPSAVFVLST